MKHQISTEYARSKNRDLPWQTTKKGPVRPLKDKNGEVLLVGFPTGWVIHPALELYFLFCKLVAP